MRITLLKTNTFNKFIHMLISKVHEEWSYAQLSFELFVLSEKIEMIMKDVNAYSLPSIFAGGPFLKYSANTKTVNNERPL